MGLEKLILFSNRDSRFIEWANKYPDIPDTLTVFGHASPSQIHDDRNGRRSLDAEEFADLIRNETDWNPNKSVHIEGCRSALGPDSLAEKLSDVLNTDVSGHDAFLIPLPGKPGNYTYSFEVLGYPLHIPGGPGRIRNFTP